MRAAHSSAGPIHRPARLPAPRPWASRTIRREGNENDKSCANGIENGNLSIPAAEEIIEEALNELAYSQDPGMARALRFLAPPGYQAIVELCSENGRSKRRTASADTWSPEEDEVRIYFERIDGEEPVPR